MTAPAPQLGRRPVESQGRTVLAAAQTLADAAPTARWAWIQRTVMRLAANLASHRRGLRMPWPLPPDGPDHGADEAADQAAAVLHRLDLPAWDMPHVSALHEVLLEHTLVDGRVVRSPDSTRKAVGVWYTPPEVAAAMCALSLGQALRQVDEANPDAGPWAVLLVRAHDPACGAGVFLVAAARWLATQFADRHGRVTAEEVLPGIITTCLTGTDIDPVAVDLAKTALWWEIDGLLPITRLDHVVTVADTLAPPDRTENDRELLP